MSNDRFHPENGKTPHSFFPDDAFNNTNTIATLEMIGILAENSRAILKTLAFSETADGDGFKGTHRDVLGVINQARSNLRMIAKTIEAKRVEILG